MISIPIAAIGVLALCSVNFFLFRAAFYEIYVKFSLGLPSELREGGGECALNMGPAEDREPAAEDGAEMVAR